VSETPPLRAAIIPVTPLQQNCTLLWCTATMQGAFVDQIGRAHVELQSRENLVCRLLLEKKKKQK